MDAPTTAFFSRARAVRLGLVMLAVATWMLFGRASGAHPPYPPGAPPYSVTLEDAEGHSLRAFRQAGTTFVLGYVGERYNVRITNRTDRRVEAVLTVDGRDAVSGAPGDFVHERGYLLAPYGSVVVDGFRRSLDQTAAFRFSRPGESYSARMGTPENVGVIGVAFFPERRRVPARRPLRTWEETPRWHAPWEHRHAEARDDAYSAASGAAERGPGRQEPAPSTAGAAEKRGAPTTAPPYGDGAADDRRAPSEPQRGRLGTEYGERTWSPATEVPFQREDSWRPDSVVSLRYDDADGLTARGIDLYPTQTWDGRGTVAPDPFPESRFAAPPP